MKTILPLLSMILTGCATVGQQQEQTKPAGEFQWRNDKLYSAADRGELSSSELNHEFVTAQSQCKIEALKIPVPSPSCTQPPKQDCTGKTGFSLGMCQRYVPNPRCDYSSVNAAYDAQNQVFESCMGLKGWSKIWVPFDEHGNPIQKASITPGTSATESDVVQAAIDANPDLAYWQKHDEKKWSLAVAIDSEIRVKPEYEGMLLVERFRIVVEKVKALSQ